jgi:ABC-type lipoprotein release transport system permease subunit
MFSSLRFALRALFKSPSFTATALTTLALCLGANLTIFAVVDAVLLRPLPFPDPDRLVTIFNTYPQAGVERDGASLTNYYERRGQLAAFSDLAEIRFESAIVGEPGSTDRVDAARVTPEFFRTLGVAPLLGRTFHEIETTYGSDAVVILTDAYWRRHFHADPAILSRPLRINGASHRIVGVLPPDFRFLSSTARLFIPLSSDPASRGPAGRHSGNAITMIGRLAPGVSLPEAQSQIDAHNAALAASYPQAKMIAEAGFRSIVTSLHADHVAGIRNILLLLQGGVFLLLLLGGVNLVNLLLIRASNRLRDFAIRQSLGATAGHVLREVMAETLLLATVGGIGGLLLAAFGIDLVRLLGADRLPLGAQIAFAARLGAVALAGSVALGIIIALPIAWFNLRAHPADTLRSCSRATTGHRSTRRLQHAFVVTQLALAFILLAGACLLRLSLQRAQAVSPGFGADHVLAGRLSLPWQGYHGDALVPFAERLVAEIAHHPGVSAAGLATTLPLNAQSGLSAVTVKGHAVAPGQSVRGHYSYGRAALSCVVDEAFARRYWPDADALGQRIFIGSRERSDAEAFTVVGVVGTVKQTQLTEADAPGTAYFPLGHRPDLDLFVVVRATLPPAAVGSTLQASVRRLDPELVLSDLQSMDERIGDTLVTRRSPALLTAIFAGIALLLAVIGTYGVLSFAVAQRHREIGIRLALGAPGQRVLTLVLRDGLRVALAGLAVGLLAALASGRLVASFLFGVSPYDPIVYVAVAGLLFAAAITACLLPARRATKVDPMVVLRAE